MAMSVETAALLAHLIESSGAQRIADLGSGFTSFVAREAAPTAEVWSVDDSPEWLNVTRRYLRSHRLSSDLVVSWDEFRNGTQHKSFDLVSHDLGSMETRLTTLPDAIARVRPDGGLLLLDDMHKIGYAPSAWPMLAEAGMSSYSLRNLTFDSLDRFAALACNDRKEQAAAGAA